MSIFKNTIVGIDFHDYSAQIVEISISGEKKYLEAYNRALIPADVIVDGEIKKLDDLKIILRELFDHANPHPITTKTLAITFPSSKILTHIFTFPGDLKEDEIRKVISYEAETVIPFSMNDIYWDYTILEKSGCINGHTNQRVLFACINKQIADQYCSLFEEIETSPTLFSITSDSLKYSIAPEFFSDKTNMIIDVDTLGVNYLILENSVIKHFFSSNEGGKKLIKEISKATSIVENATIEIKEKNQLNVFQKTGKVQEFIEKNYKRGQKIMEEYQVSKTKKIDQVLLTGEFINLPGFMGLAKQYFPDYRIVMGDPKLGLIIESTKFNLEEADKDEYIPYSIYFNNSIGSALRAFYSSGINLLPDSLRESFISKKRTILMGIASVLMTLVTMTVATFISFNNQNVSYEQERLLAKKSAITKMIYGARYQEIRGQIATFNDEVNELTKIDKKLFSAPNMIKEIYKLMPKGIEITSFSFLDEDLIVDVNGIAEDREILLKTEDSLKKAEFVEQLISPISNYDIKTNIPFKLTIKLIFTKLEPYGSSATKN